MKKLGAAARAAGGGGDDADADAAGAADGAEGAEPAGVASGGVPMARAVRLMRRVPAARRAGDYAGLLTLAADDGVAIARGSAPSAITKCYQPARAADPPGQAPGARRRRDQGDQGRVPALWTRAVSSSAPTTTRPSPTRPRPRAPTAPRSRARTRTASARAFACPRCKVEFNWASSGNPDYYYNFFMQSARAARARGQRAALASARKKRSARRRAAASTRRVLLALRAQTTCR